MANGPLVIDLMHPMDAVLQFPTIGRVLDQSVDIPLWIKYDGQPYDLTGYQLGFYGRDAKGVAKIALQDPVGPAIEAGRVTFKMPGAAFQAAGQYQEAWFRIEKDGQLVSSLNIKFNVLENNVEFGVNDEPYYSDIELMIKKFKTDIDNSKGNASSIIESYRKQFQDIYDKIADQSTDVANHLKLMIAQLEIMQAKISASDIATSSQLKQAIDGINTNLLSEINKRPLNTDVVDMLERGFANFDGGQPHAIADEATLKNTYPGGHDGVFIAIDTGHMWMWGPQGQWIDGGVYQGTEIKAGSVDTTKLAGNAQTPIFIPSKDGIPNYDTTSGVFDFNCKTDSAYFMISNSSIQVPKLTSIKNSINTSGSTSTKLIYDAKIKQFSFIAWGQILSNDQTMLGGLRHSNSGWYWSGSMNITIDGKQVDQYNIAPNILFSPSAVNLPDFNSQTRVFNFNSLKATTATVVIGERIISIPEGAVANPSDAAKDNNTLRLVFNLLKKTGQVLGWAEAVPPYCVTIATILMNHGDYPIINGGFPYTIDGLDPSAIRSNLNFVASKDGAPFYNVVNNTFDLNCYTDQAYIYINNQLFRFPYSAKIVNGQTGSSARFVVKPDTMEMKAIAWGEKIKFGWTELAAIRKTVNNEVLITANFPVTVKGASSKSHATLNNRDAKILGINHRGFNIVAPEESRSAYLLSKQNGYAHWEGDINWTKDNVPMMIHDLAINRTARNLDGTELSVATNLTDLNYADLAKFDFGILKGERFKSEPLLTFEELVKLARYNDTFLHIELKYEFTKEQIQSLHDIVVKYNMLDRIGWQAFGWDWLKPMMELEPNGQYELLGGTINDDYFAKIAALKTDTNRIVVSQNIGVSVEDIQKIADKGYPIYIWTVDDGATARKFRDIGMVEGIMTNGAINVADELAK